MESSYFLDSFKCQTETSILMLLSLFNCFIKYANVITRSGLALASDSLRTRYSVKRDYFIQFPQQMRTQLGAHVAMEVSEMTEVFWPNKWRGSRYGKKPSFERRLSKPPLSYLVRCQVPGSQSPTRGETFQLISCTVNKTFVPCSTFLKITFLTI